MSEILFHVSHTSHISLITCHMCVKQHEALLDLTNKNSLEFISEINEVNNLGEFT